MDQIKEKNKYTDYGTGGEKKSLRERNSGRESYGANYQIPGRIRNDPQPRRDDPQPRRDDPQIRRDNGIKVPSYNPSMNPG